MYNYLRKQIKLSFLVNPFYLYVISFLTVMLVYLFGWSRIFPDFSPELIIFMIFSSALFFLSARKFRGWINLKFNHIKYENRIFFINDLIFYIVIALGILNVILMGYLPILDRSRNYLDFGIPLLDPLFNSLSIFFSAFFFLSYLLSKKKRYLFYVLLYILFHLLIFRRSAVVWIIMSSIFLYILYVQKVRILSLIIVLFLLPVFSYNFGMYGALRSKLNKSYIENELGASTYFIDSGLNQNHYLTYLYISSPLANLQKNINDGKGFFNRRDLKSFMLYCIVPTSVTLRLEEHWNLSAPECKLIHPHLIAGSFFMIGFYTLGWFGMILMIFYLLIFILTDLFIIRRFEIFGATTFSLLVTTIVLLTFSNFLNRLDVILFLFVYPVIFHLIYKRNSIPLILSERN
jgi:hypothetical protein